MLQKRFHFSTVCGWAILISATAGVHQKLHVKLNVLLLLPAPIRTCRGLCAEVLPLHLVRMLQLRIFLSLFVARVAHVEILASLASPHDILDVRLAYIAGMDEGRHIRVVKVVEDHHGRVLCTPFLVELIVIALAQ